MKTNHDEQRKLIIHLKNLKSACLVTMAPGLKVDPRSENCFLEFEVDDVDREYERLKALQVNVIKPPPRSPGDYVLSGFAIHRATVSISMHLSRQLRYRLNNPHPVAADRDIEWLRFVQVVDNQQILT